MLGTIRGTNNKTRDKTLGGLTLLGLVKRESTWDHCPFVQNATITTKGYVLPDAISARRSAIWLVTVGVLVLVEIITIVGTPEQLRMLSLVMSVVFRGISKRLPEVEEWKPWQSTWEWQCSSKGLCGGQCGNKSELERRNGDKNQVCLLCDEVILNKIQPYNFFCASLESITTIEKLGKWEKVWEDIPTLYLGFVWAGKMEFGEVGSFGPSFLITNFACFDVIIGMDWLAKYHAVIDYAEKIVRILWGNETLIVHGDENIRGNETCLNIISCTKTDKYLLKGHHVFLAYVTTKETEDKSGEKQLKDVPIIRDFPEVFPEDFLGLPPTRQVEFQIDLMPGAAPVAQAPYRLAPSEMKELSEQLQELSDKGFIRPSSPP
ncbi:putative reverse transcriptase domain-containing protein [Tanacetum coccineum]